MNEVNQREKAAIYLGGAFVIAIGIWAAWALFRSEGMTLDYKLGIASAAVIAWALMRRRMRKPKA